jgi:mRNA interferase RelE/StbE
MLVQSTPSFDKDISKIKDALLAARIEKVIRKMQVTDNVFEISGIKKLSRASNAYRIRIADYRLEFKLINNTIQLIIFAHRKEIYRYFP